MLLTHLTSLIAVKHLTSFTKKYLSYIIQLSTCMESHLMLLLMEKLFKLNRDHFKDVHCQTYFLLRNFYFDRQIARIPRIARTMVFR